MNYLLRCISLTLFALFCAGGIASSQTAQSENGYVWQSISLQHVRPDFMVYWLDPARHPMPQEMQISQNSATWILQSDKRKAVSTDNGNNGIQNSEKVLFTPDNARSRVWIYATPPQFEQIKERVISLDQPRRSIKFETQIIQVQTDDKSVISKLALDKKELTYLPATPERIALLDNFIAQGNAEIINNRSISTLNNLHALIGKNTTEKATIKIAAGENNAKIIEAPTQLEKRSTLLFTPSINSDNSITVFVTVANGQILKNDGNSSEFLIENGQSIQTSAFTAKNGEIILLAGADLDSANQNPAILRIKVVIADSDKRR